MIDIFITWLALKPRVYLNLITIVLTTIGILSLSYYSQLTAQQELEDHARFTARIIDDTQITDSIYQLHLTALNFTQTGNASAAEKSTFTTKQYAANFFHLRFPSTTPRTPSAASMPTIVVSTN